MANLKERSRTERAVYEIESMTLGEVTHASAMALAQGVPEDATVKVGGTWGHLALLEFEWELDRVATEAESR